MDFQQRKKVIKPEEIHVVSTAEDSKEFNLLVWALNHSSVVGLDAEWKPRRTKQYSFPTVSLLQISCRVSHELIEYTDSQNSIWIFLVDLSVITLSSIYQLLRDMFISPDILKLGFRFKQDLVYLSSTFFSQGCDPGFAKVEPYLDITSIYQHHKQQKQPGRKMSKDVQIMHFMGPNTFREPWHLPYSPHEAIIEIVYEDAFNRFIDEINSVTAYEWCEGSMHNILSVVAYPCAWSWKQWCRRNKIHHLQEYVKSEYAHSCLQSCRSRALYKGMKEGQLGFDSSTTSDNVNIEPAYAKSYLKKMGKISPVVIKLGFHFQQKW